MSDEQVMESLWPDADGDTAFQSFETTLHRLRKLLGIDTAVIRSESRISMDPRICWIDVREFGKLIREAGGQDRPESLVLLQKALALYHGNFLAGDKERPWLVSSRERLKSRYLRAVLQAGADLEQQHAWADAAVHYQKAIDIDDLAEEFYQRLLVCYGNLGRRAEAVSLYERLRNLLSTIGIDPSARTQEIYSHIVQNP